MRYYAAPMEGITGYVYRRAHQACYPGTDCYFTPFLSPGSSGKLTSREKNDILPEHNGGLWVVPQILTSRAEDFLWVCRTLYEYGYREVNLNLGCPSGTVTAKGKGAGFLSHREELSRFLERCFEEAEVSLPDLAISVKTRVGFEREEEFECLLGIFNAYPIKELIIHPRICSDYYKGALRMEAFRLGFEKSRCPVCYNGDIFSKEDGRRAQEQFPELSSIMAGRGLIASPWLLSQLKGVEDDLTGLRRLETFLGLLLEEYGRILSGDRNVLFKMKELWYYLGCHFPESSRTLKRIRKAQRISEYEAAVRELFAGERFDAGAGFLPPL